MTLENEIINFINKTNSSERRKHSKGVARVAVKMASRESLSPEKARIAALLHDIAKDFSEEELIKMASESDWKIDKYEKLLPSLLHAPVGADIARRKFNISDHDILEAIRYHTVGSPDMGKLALIIFVADIIEPERKFPGVEKLRLKAQEDLIEAVVAVCNCTLRYNINKERIIHPNTLLLRNKYIGGS